ncbi:hypothetical protein V6Z11_A02G095400 [Gossypium hirsutum]
MEFTLVRSMISENEASRILSIPFSRLASDDMLVWKGDPTGCYTVRSGNKMLLPSTHLTYSHTTRNPPTCSRDLYTTLWKARVPPKLQITTWRFFQNYVPTFFNLYNKCISPTQYYPKC